MLLVLLACLPLVALCLLMLAVWDERTGIRTAFVNAAVCWSLLAFAITETLSCFQSVTRAGLMIAWLLVILSAAFFTASFRRTNLGLPRRWVTTTWSAIDDLDLAFVAAILGIASLVGLIAIAAPPNTIDGLTYHMPRIVHWLQNRSVSFYATNDLRQIIFPPWAQYAMLQLHGLSGSDRFDNLVQWFCLLGSGIGASLIARVLGAGMRGQVLAAILCVTIPQAVLGASGTQDTGVTAFWVVLTVYFTLTYSQDPNTWNALALGAAAGLALLTKPTVLILMPPLVIAAALARRSSGLQNWMKGAAVALLMVAAVNGLHLVRIYDLYHLPPEPSVSAPPSDLGMLFNQAYGLPQTASNVIRNLALHATTPSLRINGLLEKVVNHAVRSLGQDPSDPRTTFRALPFHISRPVLHEDVMGDPIHLVLIALACILLVWRSRTPALRGVSWLACGFVISFLVFCIALKWQPWHSRLHLPLFVVGSAVAGVVLAELWPRGVTAILGMTLVVAAMPFVFENQTRPVVSHSVFGSPRADQYFANILEERRTYEDAVEFVKTQDCTAVGLDTGTRITPLGDIEFEPYEYALQALLGNVNGERPVKVVNVTNVSTRYASGGGGPVPCVICPECVHKKSWASLLSQFSSRTSFGEVEVLTGRRSPDSTRRASDQAVLNAVQDAADDLSLSARRAAAEIQSRQEVPGFWLTSYTDDPYFRHPRLEMNTFLTSVMVDVLDPVSAAAGLEENLQRARRHLSDQIEDGGLVRYHGRRDGPTIGTSLGCPITPDTDNTALVWRIAPGPHPELLPAALATLNSYRTPQGLYRTWLAPKDRFQCIDPGKDPDPADVGIQMHLLMLLARVDPTAGQALCRALGNAIDDDRIWVYYQIAPVIPMLRQADLRSAGCSLTLPKYRLHTAAEQDEWVAASRLLVRFLGVGDPAPATKEVDDLLRRLSQDDFASLRRSPPLLYHNDMTASVPRFYWSQEFGYALWLRLYLESGRHGSVRAITKDENAKCCLR